MSIDIDFDFSDLEKIPPFLDQMNTKALPTAMRQALNKTVVSVRSKVNQNIRKKYKLKLGEINKRVLKMRKARGSNLKTMGAEIRVSPDPLSMRRFLKGSKDPIRPDFTGVAPKKRKAKKLRFEIQPGKTVVLKRTFFAQGNTNKGVVFTRESSGTTKADRLPVIARKVKGIASFVAKQGQSTEIQRFASQRLSIEFDRAFKMQLDKISKKAKSR